MFQPADVQVLGTSEAIAVVQDLEVLPHGPVWVLNSVEPFIIGFSADGEVTHEHGTQGGGPEEFRAPRGFVSGGMEGEVWAFDRARHSLIKVSDPEGEWSELLIPQDSIPVGTLVQGRDLSDTRVRTARLGDEIVLARSTGSLSEGPFSFWRSIWGGDLYAVDPTTDSVRKVLSLGETLGDPTSYLEQTDGFPPFPVWYRLWAACSDNRICVYDRLRNEMRAFTKDGVELEPTLLPSVSPPTVTHRQFARAVLGLIAAEQLGALGRQVSPEDSAQLLNQVASEMEGDPEQLRRFLPRYVDFRCGEGGTLWLRPFDVDVGGLRGGPSWLRVTPEGRTEEIQFPERFDAYRFTSDRVWGVLRDEFDVASVAWIELGGAP